MRSSTKRYANIFIVALTFSVWVYVSFSHRSRRKRVQFIPNNFKDLSLQREIFTELGYKETTDTYSADFIYLADMSYSDRLSEIKINATINYLPGISILSTRRNLYEEFLNIDETENNPNIPANLGQFMPETYYLPKDRNRFLYDKDQSLPDQFWALKMLKDHSILAITNKDKYFDKFVSTKNTYIQQLIHPPLLIENRKLEASVFVIIKTAPVFEEGVTSTSKTGLPKKVKLEHAIYPRDWLFYFSNERYASNNDQSSIADIINTDKKLFQSKSIAREKSTHGNSEGPYLTKALVNEKYFPETFSELESNVETIIHIVMSSLAELPENKGVLINYFQLLKFNFVFDENQRPYLLDIEPAQLGKSHSGRHDLDQDILSWSLKELRLR